MLPANLLRDLPPPADEEIFETLLSGGPFKLERIVTRGQTTPPGQWFDQELDEWVIVLAGAARLRFEDQEQLVELVPGDWVHIAAHRRHRVEWVAPDQTTIWLAIHYAAQRPTVS